MKTKAFFALVLLCERAGGSSGWPSEGRAEERRGSEEPPARERGKSCGAKAAALLGRGQDVSNRERPGEEEGDWLDCDDNMRESSMAYYYCQ
jgi:hypothetical protein